jgi:hypothetical protein
MFWCRLLRFSVKLMLMYYVNVDKRKDGLVRQAGTDFTHLAKPECELRTHEFTVTVTTTVQHI